MHPRHPHQVQLQENTDCYFGEGAADVNVMIVAAMTMVKLFFCWVLRCLSVLHVSLLPHFYARELAHISHGNSVCLSVSLFDVLVSRPGIVS